MGASERHPFAVRQERERDLDVAIAQVQAQLRAVDQDLIRARRRMKSLVRRAGGSVVRLACFALLCAPIVGLAGWCLLWAILSLLMRSR